MNNMRKFVIGDIHGGARGLMQVLQKANVDYNNDLVIQLGDIVDGWSETYESVEELMKIKNLILIQGNHDEWFKDWLFSGVSNRAWEMHGGEATKKSYIDNFGITDHKHKEFWAKQVPYYVDGNKLFVHGGLNRHESLEEQEDFVFCWDRDFWMQALSHSKMTDESQKKYGFKITGGYKEVYLGHTPVQHWGYDVPMNAGGRKVWNLDTGAAFKGKLSIMNIDTKEVWQSDPLFELYPEERGRN